MIVVFGSVNLDLIFALDHLPSAGETVLGPTTRLEPGGKGANQAAAAARDGARVLMAGCVGRDALADAALARLSATGRVVHGEFRPGGTGLEWCDAEVLRMLRRRSLAALRREIEPVPPRILAAFLPRWHQVGGNARGVDAVAATIEQLQGIAVPASAWVSIDVLAWTEAEQVRVDDAIRALESPLEGARLVVHGGINRPPLERAMAVDLYTTTAAVAAGPPPAYTTSAARTRSSGAGNPSTSAMAS